MLVPVAGGVLAFQLGGQRHSRSFSLTNTTTANFQVVYPNYSIFFYNRGNGMAVTGTVQNGAFTQKASFYLGGNWNHAAVSRDTLLIYNSNSGYAKTAKLTNGSLGAKTLYYLGKGWTHVVASCDSYLLYQTGTGYGQTGLLTGGTLQSRQSLSGFSNNWKNVSASCDTAVFNTFTFNSCLGDGSGVDAWGTLSSGYWSMRGSDSYTTGILPSLLTSTTDSWTEATLPHDCSLIPDNDYLPPYTARVGSASGGILTTTGGVRSSTWTHVAGTADSVLFYDTNSGAGATFTIANGNYTNGHSEAFSTGWTLIAGGK